MSSDSDININIKSIQDIDLNKLEFDDYNPRFGSDVGKVTDQTKILDQIVNEYGVEDVLSSLAVNGYFRAEPIIVRKQEGKDKYTVVEGNRRLASCLILVNDPRAKNQQKRRNNILKSLKVNPQSYIPAIVYDEQENEKEIISYLGVRHIASAQPWDSYAKAAWVAKVIDQNNLTLDEVTTMIGERTGTISRMLDGFYLVNQLIDAGKFYPSDSIRKGRGSNTEYPFSWVYTLLGSPPVKRFLGIDGDSTPKENPIPKEKLDDASMLIEALFGNSSSGRRPAIDDSRALGRLAAILDEPEKIVYLKRGETVSEITHRFEPVTNILSEGLTDCNEILKRITSTLGEQDINVEEAQKHLPMILKVRKLSQDIHKRLADIINNDSDITDL